MITIDELKFKLGGLETAVNDLRDALSIEASEKRLAELEHQMTLPGFYDDQEKSQKVISEMGEVKNKLERFGKLSTQYEEAQTLLEICLLYTASSPPDNSGTRVPGFVF